MSSSHSNSSVDLLNTPKYANFVDFCNKEQYKEKLPIPLYLFEKKHLSTLGGMALFLYGLFDFSLVEVTGLWALFVGFKYSKDTQALAKRDVYTLHPLIRSINELSALFQIKEARFSADEIAKIAK